MLDFLRNLMNSDALAPHGICLLWRPELIWTMVASDALIAVAYFSIPVALAYFVSKRKDIAFTWVFWCFAVFIMACGLTHLMEIVTLWRPDYGPEALVKAGTALASIATAAALWPLIPHALALPSPAQLRQINEDLAQRVEERDAAMKALHGEIAERQRTEDMLRQAQKMEAVGQLTGGIAHDFNNMMTAVLMNIGRAQKQAGGDAGKLSIALDNARAGAERAAKLTEQLLAFARKQPLEPKNLDVNPLIRDLAPLLENALGDTREFELRLASDPCLVCADAQQLEACLLNLVVNARDAIPGSGSVTITTQNVIARKSTGPAVMIEVTDTGEGMTDDVLSHACEPFFTTKPIGKGSGLGLSQVYGFVSQSGGDIAIDSAPGIGTKVQMFLPSLVVLPSLEV